MSRRMRLMVTGLLLAGIAVFVLAAVIADNASDDPPLSGRGEVDALIPDQGDEVLQQQTVGIDLAAPYRLTSLVIAPSGGGSAGVDVFPQVEERSGLNRYEFSPGEGKLIESLSPDTNCAVATYEEIARPDEPPQRVEWCFEVL